MESIPVFSKSLSGLVQELYAAISGPAGPRDADRERNVFLPEARLMRTEIAPDGSPVLRVMSVDEYLENTDSFFRSNAFYEVEVARSETVFGQVAHVWSSYEARHALEDSEPFKRGINSIQCFHDGHRWWVASIIWDNERPGVKMPTGLLPQSIKSYE